MFKQDSRSFDMKLIVGTTISTIKMIQKTILRKVADDQEKAFRLIYLPDIEKWLTLVDLDSENEATSNFEQKLKIYKPLVFGEESLRKEVDLSKQKNLVILMDMVDGTDLLERGLSNWCSAIVFYYPPEQKIIASFVAIADLNLVYFTGHSSDKVYKHNLKEKFDIDNLDKLVLESGVSKTESLDSASIAFYGQKIKNFLSILKRERFVPYLEKIQAEKGDPKTRIYNLAGNPMMMKLLNNHSKIDAVFDVHGQWPHDVVPGAYIAQKAGAIFTDLNGEPINWGSVLKKPASDKITYILASTDKLSKELQHIFAK